MKHENELAAKASAARIAANQANALKSTGPKTGAGRNASKMNALKHGIFSSEILVRGRHLQENHEELAALHQRMLDAYHPVGVVEEMLVDQLVTTFWRTRRLQKAEAAEIALSVDHRVEQLLPTDHQRLQQSWQNSENIELAMAQSLEGNRLMADQLNAVRRCVVKQGELNHQAIAFVQWDGEPYELTGTLEILLEDLQKNPEKLDAKALRVWQQAQVLAFLDGELAELGERINILNEREMAAAEAQTAAALVPAREVLDRLGLYETRLRRQFNTALTQLERMQRARLNRDASPVASPAGSVSEHTSTKKRTQSPAVNNPIETVTGPHPGSAAVSPTSRSAHAGPEGVPDSSVSENIQTKKRTQSPSANDNIETVNRAHRAKEDPQKMQNEKTNPNSGSFSAPFSALNA